MKITITGKNIAITQSLTDIITKKLHSISKFLPTDSTANVLLSATRNQHTIEVTVQSDDTIIRSELTSTDMYNAVDDVVAKLERQISKNRTRLEKRLKTGLPKEYFDEDKIESEFIPKIVKTKHFAVKPMSVDEAVLQMELLGHNFFVFTNCDSNKANVLYIRKDGNYGLIEPEYN